MNELIEGRIKEWTNQPYDKNTINEIEKLVKSGNNKELTDRFYRTLEFGTGGLRGVLGAGTNRMNIYTVGRATQGLANYILNNSGSNNSVVISYDSRRMSKTFAHDTAAILAANGIKSYLFSDIMPTPLCSFAIRKLKAISGIMITASHNPPEYNGYKVFWDDGGQIISPVDSNIIEEVNKVDNITKIKKTNFDEAVKNNQAAFIGDDIKEAYLTELEKCALKKKENKSDAKIVYSPLHGAGYKIVPETLNYFGFTNIHLEKDQSIPDENFPTVSYPNPEEKDAMKLSLKLAKEVDADIILATEPDADRMGVDFKNEDNEYVLINGNQIGTMLEYYLLSRKKEEGSLPKNSEVIKTIVTTELQSEIAKDFDCKVSDVLTGFKWIANRMKELDSTKESTFIFGGEESFGYLPVNFVRDKDAVSACYFFCEMADWLKNKNSSLIEFLNEIYIKYKLYLEDLKSITLKGIDGMSQIKNIMQFFRETPPKEFANITISYINDIQNLTKKDLIKNKVTQIENLPASNVLQFFLSDGSKITMRPSGTEPKIKFYFSVNKKTSADNLEDDKLKLRDKIESFKKDLLAKIDNNK
jgi:phosphoglucomutase